MYAWTIRKERHGPPDEAMQIEVVPTWELDSHDVLVVKRGGMVVICAGTTGYKLTVDARYLWMRQKRLQGSHFANLKQASSANRFVINRQVDPCMSEVFAWSDIPRAHMKMWKNQHKPGNMAVLVQAKRPGMRTIEEAMEG